MRNQQAFLIMKDDKLNISLTRCEALVLFDFLARINLESNQNIIADQAEQRVLWDLEAILEKQLPEVVDSKYCEKVNEARKQINNKG